MIGGRKVCALVPAAGGGTRMGGGISKLFAPLAGLPVLARTLLALEESSVIDDVVLAVRVAEVGAVEELASRTGARKVRSVVPGGAERQDSVRAALSAPAARAAGVIVVHDGARPFAPPDLFDRVAAAAHDSGAALAAVRPKDTVKIAGNGGNGLSTPDRSTCWLAQTPQAFRAEIFMKAMERAATDGFRGTDDVALVERIGVPVFIIEGSYRNIKITTPEDLEIAEFLLKSAN